MAIHARLSRPVHFVGMHVEFATKIRFTLLAQLFLLDLLFGVQLFHHRRQRLSDVRRRRALRITRQQLHDLGLALDGLLRDHVRSDNRNLVLAIAHRTRPIAVNPMTDVQQVPNPELVRGDRQ